MSYWQSAPINAYERESGSGVKVRRGRISATCAAFGAALVTAPARAQDIPGDPAGSGVLVSAAQWLQGTLLGTVATVVAVIAVAAVGFMMLTGRINWRYGATVILGCFILFGAASIVAGIQSTAALGS
jgi:type IV secretion system protein VirB2